MIASLHLALIDLSDLRSKSVTQLRHEGADITIIDFWCSGFMAKIQCARRSTLCRSDAFGFSQLQLDI